MTTPMPALTREQISRPPLREAEACTLVIFGATGDLTRRKLLPALYDLQCLGGMSSRCEFVGTGRTRLANEQFRDRVCTATRPCSPGATRWTLSGGSSRRTRKLSTPTYPNYAAGSEGLAEANPLVGRGSYHWRPIITPRDNVADTVVITASADATQVQGQEQQ